MARTEVAPKQRLKEAFTAGQTQGRALLMPFLVCGYPDPEGFLSCAAAVAQAGADVLEIGIPFSDPIMDGPVIAAAAHTVLERGVHTAELLRLAGRAAEASGVPVVLMTYYNLVFRGGLERFASAAVDRGASGVIVPDLSVEESGSWRLVCAEFGLAPVFIAAQTSPPARLRTIGAAGDGFVYGASLLGVTGVRETLNEQARALVARIRDACDLPVAVGIGVSTPEHAREAAAFADGVIVGSALVSRIGEAADPAGAAGAFVAELRAAMTPRS